jgi:superfamily II DNA or RNA helicase
VTELVDEPLCTTGFELVPWQAAAVDAWAAGDGTAPHRGTLEIFTGGGKTLIALACAERAAELQPDVRLAVVVPTEVLARQWRDVLLERTNLRRTDIGMLGAGRRDTFAGKRALVCVLASAAKRLPELAASAQPLMLVVDECHRAGAPKMSRVLSTPAEYRLGLSATPDREEVDDDGEPIRYDEHALGKELGRVVYRFALRDAREAGWLPDYEIVHHGIELTESERREYEDLSRQVDDAANELEARGVDTMRARMLSSKKDDLGKAALRYVVSTTARKDLLYRASERDRIATRIVLDEVENRGRPRILLFHERVAEAERLYRSLVEGLSSDAGAQLSLGGMAVAPSDEVVLEHSKLPQKQRVAAMESFRSGRSPILVSVKSLVEGVDVPEADVGVSVAASSSVRQRIQSLGRVLRRTDSDAKFAEMHLLYVADTVDEVIYAKEDWSDLTGEGANRYLRWSLDPTMPPAVEDGPPRSPRPTEEQEWVRLGERAPEVPVPYEGLFVGHEYTVDTRATVRNAFDGVVANPQGVAEMVAAVRGRPGGRFVVTPQHRLVLVRNAGKPDPGVMVAGALQEPFKVRAIAGTVVGPVDVGGLQPGDPYLGPTNADLGEYRISQRERGSVERRSGRTREYALVSVPDHAELGQNAQRLVESWRYLGTSGMKFSVNDQWHAWYLEAGEPRFLANVPDGFRFPSDGERAEGQERDIPQEVPGQ